jgi:hypothetical protein
MSRLPLQFAGRDISFRIPYNLYAEQVFDANQNGGSFPEASLLHNIDKPFEQHRWIMSVTGLDANDAIIEPQPTTLEKRVKLRIQDLSKNESITKSATVFENFLKANEQTWELDEPYTLVRAEGYQVTVDVGALPTICVLNQTDPDCTATTPVTCTQVRVQINLQGYLIVVAPPTANR